MDGTLAAVLAFGFIVFIVMVTSPGPPKRR
jgi:hypothetical protein